jgi:hypothetical protein
VFPPVASARRPAADGTAAQKTVLAELLSKLEAADQELPLYRLLRRIRDPEIDERYRDALAIATLRSCIPGPN